MSIRIAPWISPLHLYTDSLAWFQGFQLVQSKVPDYSLVTN